jgi:hypothetical protein
VDSTFFDTCSINDWPRELVCEGYRLTLRVDRGRRDEEHQDICISLFSKDYRKFLYVNQNTYFNIPNLPRINLVNFPARGKLTVAMVTYMVSLDPLKTELDPYFSCLTEPYKANEKLLLGHFSHLGEIRLQTFLSLLGEIIKKPEDILNGLCQNGIISQNFAVFNAEYLFIFFALTVGKPQHIIQKYLEYFELTDTNKEALLRFSEVVRDRVPTA